jgi:hypothetical protein
MTDATATPRIRLQIHLSGAGTPDEAAKLEVTVDGERRLEIAIRVEDLSPLLDPSKSPPLRRELLGNVRDLLTRTGPTPDAPLWLAFRSPAGLLPAHAWEAVIQPALGRPVLREAYLSLASPMEADPLTVVVCASAPVSKSDFDVVDAVARLVRQVTAAPAREVNVHVFADAGVYPLLTDQFEGLAPGRTVIVHDPSTADYEAPTLAKTIIDEPGVRNPWLRWVSDRLPSRAPVSVVHFAAHGYESLGLGAVALAETPNLNRDRDAARFVGPEQIAGLLTRLGAWGVGFASPPRNHSPKGLWLLADGLARRVPGPVFVHQLMESGGPDSAAAMYRYLCQPAEPPNAPLSVYLHPSAVGAGSSTPVPRSLSRPRPRWVAATERFLVQKRSQVEPGQTAGRGRLQALAFIEGLLSEPEPAADPLAGVSEAVQGYADALDSAVVTWGPNLTQRPTVGDIDQLAKVSAAVAHLASEVGNTERIVRSLAHQPEAAQRVGQHDLEAHLERLRAEQVTLNGYRQQLGSVIRAAVRLQQQETTEQPDTSDRREAAERALSKAWEGVVGFLKEAPELTRGVRDVAGRLSGPANQPPATPVRPREAGAEGGG